MLERSYGNLISGLQNGSMTSAGDCWVHLDTTVIYLGEPSDAKSVLNGCSPEPLFRFKHVALTWHQFGELARTCLHLATICPALRTIIIQRSKRNEEAKQGHAQPLSLETAACFAIIPEYTGPEIRDEGLDALHLRALLLEYFSESPPKLHSLSPLSSQRSASAQPL